MTHLNKSSFQGINVCQKLTRQFLNTMRVENVYRASAALIVQTHWRSFCISKMISEALEASRLNNAATVIQANWRAHAQSGIYNITKSCVISLQSVVRVKLAIVRKNKKIQNLAQAAAYQANDFFGYSKNRKEAAIKIQASCRKFLVVKKFVRAFALAARELAATKIQCAYRMHSTGKFPCTVTMNSYSSESSVKDLAVQFSPVLSVLVNQLQGSFLSFFQHAN